MNWVSSPRGEQGMNTRPSETISCPLQGFILKIVYGLHIILKEFEIWGEIIEHINMCYIWSIIELQTVLKTDVEQF